MTGHRWSCSTRSFPIAPFDLAVRIAAGLGFSAADLSVAANSRHLALQRFLDHPAASTDEVVRIVSSRGMQIADVRIDATAAPPAPLVELAQRCRAALLTLVWNAGDSPENVAAFSRLASAAGLQSAVEAGAGTPPEAIAELSAQTGLGVTLDYGTFLANGITEDRVNNLLPLVTHMRVRGVAAGAFQVAWHDNVVNYRGAIETLHSRGYDGFFAADYVWDPALGRNRNDTIAETVQMLRALDCER
jgi:hypothetical protein